MPDSTWGELGDDDAGQPLVVWFWWDEQPTTTTFVRRIGVDRAAPDGVDLIRCVLDYGGELGEQETQLRADAPVAVGAGAAEPPQIARPAPPPGAPILEGTT